jgi:hypothetical protein
MRVLGTGDGRFVAVLVCLAGAVTAAVLALLHWPSTLDAARAVDRHFRLKDRVTTAVEFEGSSEPLVVLQRRQVGKLVRALPLRESARFLVPRRELAALGAAALLIAVGLALPARPTVTPVVAHQVPSLTDAQRRAAAAQVRSIAREFTAGLPAGQRRSTVARKVLSIMSRLEARLKEADSPEQALRDTSEAQLRLQRIMSSLHPVTRGTGNRLKRALSHRLTPRERARLLGGRRHAGKSASTALQHLATRSAKMTAKQRLDVARALQAAANRMPNDSVRSDLQKAAGALGHNDLSTAQQALRHAADRLDNSDSQRVTKTKVDKSRKGLDAVKRSINRASRKLPHGRTGNGQNPPPNGARSAMQGGSERGNSSPGNGPASDGGRHQNASQLAGRQGDDAANNGGGKNHAGTDGAGRYAVVYVPGRVRKGGRPLPYELHGSPKRVPAVPYRRVIAQYQRSARVSLDRAPLPPSMQEYVRRYFTALSHQ